jgi:hypothetical protein
MKVLVDAPLMDSEPIASMQVSAAKRRHVEQVLRLLNARFGD